MAFPLFFILIVFLFGLSLGAGVTAIVMSARRSTIVESSNEPPTVRDPSNPYEPSGITNREVGSKTGCGLAGVVLLILGGLMVAAILAFVTLRARAVAPAPNPPPPTVVQPPQAPTTAPAPLSANCHEKQKLPSSTLHPKSCLLSQQEGASS